LSPPITPFLLRRAWFSQLCPRSSHVNVLTISDNPFLDSFRAYRLLGNNHGLRSLLFRGISGMARDEVGGQLVQKKSKIKKVKISSRARREASLYSRSPGPDNSGHPPFSQSFEPTILRTTGKPPRRKCAPNPLKVSARSRERFGPNYFASPCAFLLTRFRYCGICQVRYKNGSARCYQHPTEPNSHERSNLPCKLHPAYRNTLPSIRS
jgi:hypothetical protein